MGNGYPSLAVAWNATNTVILGSFVLTAWREGHKARATAKAERAPRRDVVAELETALTGGAA
jgi:cellulose synthase (UDP-forming)